MPQWGVLMTRVLYTFSCHERQTGSRSGHMYDLDVTGLFKIVIMMSIKIFLAQLEEIVSVF